MVRLPQGFELLDGEPEQRQTMQMVPRVPPGFELEPQQAPAAQPHVVDRATMFPLVEMSDGSFEFGWPGALKPTRDAIVGGLTTGTLEQSMTPGSYGTVTDSQPDGTYQDEGTIIAAEGGLAGFGQTMKQMPSVARSVARRGGKTWGGPSSQVQESAGRTLQAVDDMRQIGVKPFGPAVSAAGRGDNSASAVAQMLTDKPVVGAPLQRGSQQFLDDTTKAFDDVSGAYGADMDIQTAGGRLKAATNANRAARDVDVKALSTDELRDLAKRPVRVEGFRDVQSAKYELVERLMPDNKLGRKGVGMNETRDYALPGATQQVLLSIKNRKGQTINQSAAKRAGKMKTKDFDFANPNWTNSRDLNQSLDVLAESPNWRTGINGIREIRSMVRRVKAGMKGDNETRALAKGDLKRLEKALTQDLYGLFQRVIDDEMKAGRTEVAAQYREAFNAMKDADGFTRQYETQVFAPLRRVLHEDITPGNAASEIMAAMKDGTKGNLEKLVALRRVLPKEDLNQFAGAMLREMARPRKGAGGATQDAGFSIAKFVSEWNDMNPRAKRLIFGSDTAKYSQLERLARVATNMKDFERLANNSRTGVSNMVVGTVAAGSYGLSQISPEVLGAVLTGLAAGWGTSKFMASQAYIKWLERSAQLVRSGASPKAQQMHLKRLYALPAIGAIREDQE